MFRVAPWVQPQPFVPVRFRPDEWQAQDIEQRWFPGVHSDIGGGYSENESALSKIPLIWMIDEAEKAGLKITKANRAKFAYGAPRAADEHQYTRPDANGKMHTSLTYAWLPLEIIPKIAGLREWKRWSFLGLYLPLAEPRPVAGDHAIDSAVAQRMAADPSYRPINVSRE